MHLFIKRTFNQPTNTTPLFNLSCVIQLLDNIGINHVIYNRKMK